MEQQDLVEITTKTEDTEMLADEVHPDSLHEDKADNKRKRNAAQHQKKNCRKRGIISLSVLIVMLILLGAGVWWYVSNNVISASTVTISQAYSKAKSTSFEEVYEKSYQSSYELSESQHHVHNDIEISLGNVREIQRLEVLNVCDVDYQTPPEKENTFWKEFTDKVAFWNEDVISWLEVPGSGVFTVNLKASEFIVDSAQQHVIVRLPNPELTSFTIDYQNVQLLNFEKGGLFKDSAKVGVDTAIKQLQDAELSMLQKVNNNQEFFKKAKSSAEIILINIIKQLNPNLPNLTVEVEFYN